MGTDERGPADRQADHAAIDSLADELIPALIAKLGASGLGEIEVREGDWKVRLRRPAEGSTSTGGRRAGRSAGSATPPPARPALTPVGPGRVASPSGLEETDGRATGATLETEALVDGDAGGPGRDPFRAIATSPAVGSSSPGPGSCRAPGCGPAIRSAASTCWASRPRWSRRPTGSSGPASSSPGRRSSTARSSSGSSCCRAPRRRPMASAPLGVLMR